MMIDILFLDNSDTTRLCDVATNEHAAQLLPLRVFMSFDALLILDNYLTYLALQSIFFSANIISNLTQLLFKK